MDGISAGILDATINTAGAYVRVDGRYLFTIGTQLYHGRIPVVRLGGHREASETGWQCAAREAYEEAGVRLQPLAPPATYLLDADHEETDLRPVQWRRPGEPEQNPWLVLYCCRGNGAWLSLMYHACACETPAPAAEVKGLLLLATGEVHRLCRESLTLGQYLGSGGRAILNYAFDASLLLEPFAQFRLLSRMLVLQPDAREQEG